MTNTHAHTRHPDFASDPSGHVAAYVAAFKTGSAETLDLLYEPNGVVIPRPGVAMTGSARLGANRHLLGLGSPISASARHVYQVGDIALLIVDWTIQGTAPDGRNIELAGTATDVARRSATGSWRYVIDNPFGVVRAADG